MYYLRRRILLSVQKMISGKMGVHTKLRSPRKSTPSSSSSSSSRLSDLLLFTLPATAFALGTWQIHRLQWKKDLIAELEKKTQGEMIPLPSDILEPGRIKELRYQRVSVEGKFDHTKEILLGPRSLMESDSNTNRSGGPKTGYHIVTPFILTSGERILVNRGWVPSNKTNPVTRMEGQIDGVMHLSGLLRCHQDRPRGTPKGDDDSLTYHYRDLNKFSQLLNTLPVLIDGDVTSTVKGGPIGGQTIVHIRNEHLTYIITWYSLAVVMSFMFYKMRRDPSAKLSSQVHKFRE